MERFKFSDYGVAWPEWFVDLIEKDKVQATSDVDLSFENGDDWKNNLIYIAFYGHQMEYLMLMKVTRL